METLHYTHLEQRYKIKEPPWWGKWILSIGPMQPVWLVIPLTMCMDIKLTTSEFAYEYFLLLINKYEYSLRKSASVVTPFELPWKLNLLLIDYGIPPCHKLLTVLNSWNPSPKKEIISYFFVWSHFALLFHNIVYYWSRFIYFYFVCKNWHIRNKIYFVLAIFSFWHFITYCIKKYFLFIVVLFI